MKKIFTSILTMSIVLTFQAQNVNIPDANFKVYLVGNSLINTNNDDEIQLSEAAAFSGQMNCSGLSISSLVGIEAFTSLTHLYCNSNNLTSLDVSNNTNLTTLHCGFNSINSLNLGQINSLIYLNCMFNQISAIDLSHLSLLEDFTCTQNFLTTLNLSNNLGLIYLSCGNNQLTGELDLSNHTSLIAINCFSNQLTALNAKNGNNMNFTTFYVGGNQITCIEVDDPVYSYANWGNSGSFGYDATAIFSEDCSSCNVYIPDSNFKAYLLANSTINTNGDSEIQCSEAEAFTGAIGCSGLNITSLNGIESFINLTGLICADNQLTDLNLSSNTAIVLLECHNNQLTTLNLGSNTALIDFTCFNNLLSSLDLSNNPVLATLSCQNNQLISLNLANGNNANFEFISTTNNPLLTCVKVDNANYSASNWTAANEFYFDAIVNFSEDCSSINSIQEKSTIDLTSIYPNPVASILNIEVLDNIEVEIVNSLGSSLKTLQLTKGKNSIDLSDFSNGIYFIYTPLNHVVKFIKD
jgi:hypothetical protein